MTDPDFAAILYDAADPVPVSYSGQYPLQVAVDLQLAARVPALCTTCGGTTVTHNERHEWADIQCPDCPTIGRLLAIGAAVMTAESSEDGWVVQLPGQLATNFSVPLLTQLREVQPT